jgi:CheY-like chemotaxis protein
MVAISVSDNGPGIAPEIRSRIFDPFFTTKPVGQGTGLGLAICRSIVTDLGGELTCAAAPEGGSTFTVSIPIAPSPTAEGSPAAVSAAPRGKVLVVDDEPLVRRSLEWTLADQHDVVSVGDSREAARLFEDGARYDLVICDLMMPHLNGAALYRLVRELDAAQAERFIFITGGALRRDLDAFLAGVPNKRLEKPFQSSELRAVARRFVDNHRQAP